MGSRMAEIAALLQTVGERRPGQVALEKPFAAPLVPVQVSACCAPELRNHQATHPHVAMRGSGPDFHLTSQLSRGWGAGGGGKTQDQ